MKQKISPSLWFDGNAEEAAEFYASVFDDSRAVNTTRPLVARRASAAAQGPLRPFLAGRPHRDG